MLRACYTTDRGSGPICNRDLEWMELFNIMSHKYIWDRNPTTRTPLYTASRLFQLLGYNLTSLHQELNAWILPTKRLDWSLLLRPYTNLLLPQYVFRATNRYAEGHGFEPIWVLAHFPCFISVRWMLNAISFLCCDRPKIYQLSWRIRMKLGSFQSLLYTRG